MSGPTGNLGYPLEKDERYKNLMQPIEPPVKALPMPLLPQEYVALNIRVADKLGYTDIRGGCPYGVEMTMGVDPVDKRYKGIPAFSRSLDACEKLRRFLDTDQRRRWYFHHLLSQMNISEHWHPIDTPAYMQCHAFIMAMEWNPPVT